MQLSSNGSQRVILDVHIAQRSVVLVRVSANSLFYIIPQDKTKQLPNIHNHYRQLVRHACLKISDMELTVP